MNNNDYQLVQKTRSTVANSMISKEHFSSIDRRFKEDDIRSILSPYRINPVGAHVDHQGGQVLAQTIDQYTVLSYSTLPSVSSGLNASAENPPSIYLTSLQTSWPVTDVTFVVGETNSAHNWVRYAQAAAAALNQHTRLKTGLHAVVDGTFIGSGLSSSASAVLAYLKAFSGANNILLTDSELVELSRRVENDYMGLNNGIQDQMSIVYGKEDSLAYLDVDSATSKAIPTPDYAQQSTKQSHAESKNSVCWVVLYSGFSRELINSGFNDRVAECRQAAAQLQAGASRLGDVSTNNRGDAFLSDIDPMLARRARHFFSETSRVDFAAEAWAKGQWREFGSIMNASCKSSIELYESGSPPLVDAHRLALNTAGVYGSRFGGGGYGGCLMMLCDRTEEEQIRNTMLEEYLQAYPEKSDVATTFTANPTDGIRELPVNI